MTKILLGRRAFWAVLFSLTAVAGLLAITGEAGAGLRAARAKAARAKAARSRTARHKAAPKKGKDANARKKISARPFKARKAGARMARRVVNRQLAAATFRPTKGAPTFLSTSTPDYSLSSPTVNVTFAGQNWTSADKATVINAVKAIVNSAYLSALNQDKYGSDGKAVWGISSTSKAALKLGKGTYPSLANLDDFFKASPVGNKALNTINVVVNDTTASPSALGYNYSRGKAKAGSYIYVGTRTFKRSFDKDAFTEVVSHELAEAMTAGVQISDPGNFGKGQAGNQIADNEPDPPPPLVGYYALLAGTTIKVQAYWSARDQVWIVPGGK
jgi:hypothetical protein